MQDSRSAILTVAEVADTLARGNITSLSAQVAIEDALDDAQSALDELIAEEVPTAHARELRDTTVPLLATATSLIHDVAAADDSGDHNALNAANAKLRDLAGNLTGVLDRAQ